MKILRFLLFSLTIAGICASCKNGDDTNDSAASSFSDSYLQNLENNLFIAHAGGAINGDVYTNSKEAFEETVSDGFNIAEADIMPTSDGDYVLCHQIQNITDENITSFTLSEFLSMKLCSKYTPLSLEQFLAFAKTKNLTCVLHVLNINGYESGVLFSKRLDKLADEDSHIYILVSDFGTYSGIKNGKSHNWQYIFWCGDIYNDSQVCRKEGIKVLTVSENTYKAELLKNFVDQGFSVYVYKCEDKSAAADYFNNGVGIYSNFISPKSFP